MTNKYIVCVRRFGSKPDLYLTNSDSMKNVYWYWYPKFTESRDEAISLDIFDVQKVIGSIYWEFERPDRKNDYPIQICEIILVSK